MGSACDIERRHVQGVRHDDRPPNPKPVGDAAQTCAPTGT
jgi:hypothetical protein